MKIAPGLVGHASMTVTEADTAALVGSGDVPVLATPRVLTLAEAATVAAVRAHLPADATTVGVRVELDHRAPTRVGATVEAEAALTAVDGRRLRFAVLVREVPADAAPEGGPATGPEVAEGIIERAVVDRARFLARLGVTEPAG